MLIVTGETVGEGSGTLVGDEQATKKKHINQEYIQEFHFFYDLFNV
jgi:hypothetical protein